VGPRTLDRTVYDYVFNLQDSGFCIFANLHEFDEGGTSDLTYGFWLNGGRLNHLVSDTRTCARDPKEWWATRARIDVADEFGVKHRAIGRSLSHFLWPPSRWLTSTSFVEWTVDGQQPWGEDQDLWQYDQWIAAWRARNIG
jgi:hypothetical protein